MEIVQEATWRIGENCILVIAEDDGNNWWHCLAWGIEETDYIGPFATRTAAILDAKSTYLDPEWVEMGWRINRQLLDAVSILA